MLRTALAALAALSLLVAAPALAQDVLVVRASDNPAVDPDLLSNELANRGMFVTWGDFDGTVNTPTLQQLQNYHVVLLWSDNVPFADPIELGNNLADFVRAGGGLVMLGGALENGITAAGEEWDEVSPIVPGIRRRTDAATLALQAPGFQWLQASPRYIAGHPSVYGFNNHCGRPFWRVNGGLVVDCTLAQGVYRVSNLVVKPGTFVTARYDDGYPMVIVQASKPGISGRIIALNMHHLAHQYDLDGDGFPEYDSDGWLSRSELSGRIGGDGYRLMVESLLWAARYDRPLATVDNELYFQDYDCDLDDVSVDEPIDPDAPIYGGWIDTDGDGSNDAREVLGTCADRINPETGAFFPVDDYFYDYEAHSCTYVLTIQDELDDALQDPIQGDGLITEDPRIPFAPTFTDPITGFVRFFGQVPIPGPDGQTFQTASLDCDNCVFEYNPDQINLDGDEAGDLCDNCPFVPNSDQDNDCPATGMPDGDNIGVACDNCICTPNPKQVDVDIDGVGDLCDNCRLTFNPNQSEADSCPPFGFPDGFGDACDNCPSDCNPTQSDVDFDGVGDVCDNCPDTANPDQLNSDAATEPAGVEEGDACDPCPLDGMQYFANTNDADSDGVGDPCDVCPGLADPDQADRDSDGFGDACDNCPSFFNPDQGDIDEDGFGDACDVCPDIPNPDQADRDGDLVGDECDGCPDIPDGAAPDADGDGFSDRCDLCLFVASESNADGDGDGVGDSCDNCPQLPNAAQIDRDRDGIGDPCDPFVIRGGGAPQQGLGCQTAPWSVPTLGLVGLALLLVRRRDRA